MRSFAMMRIILTHWRNRMTKRMGMLAAVVVWCAAACGSGAGSSLPGTPLCSSVVAVIATVDQWGDIVRDLGGRCAHVTTVIDGSTADPHDYEPTPGDRSLFDRAQLVVENGLGYDEWSAKAVAALSRRPAVVDAGRVAGRHLGDNPHLWYSPDDVHRVATAVVRRLTRLDPGDARYFDRRLASWRASMRPYDREVAGLRGAAAGKRFAATEPVFDDMAAAIGLTPATPKGYAQAAANEADPAPADVAAFLEAIRHHQMDVLIYNTQTEGSAPDQIRRAADRAGVPIVEVSETVPPGATSFLDWQLRQLRALGRALGS
jgi:zinc/manganese transport system substrate-binding protein